MGLPNINIDFKELANNIVARSTRGTAALLLEDATVATASVVTYTDKTTADAATALFSAESIRYIKMALDGGASKVMAVRVVQSGDPAVNDYEATLESIKGMRWNWCTAPYAQSADIAQIVTWIKSARSAGLVHKAVLGGASSPDSEGIVNLTTTGIISSMYPEAGNASRTYTNVQYSAYIAGVLAGLPLDRSCTGYVLDDVSSVTLSATPDDDIDAGKFVIVFNGESYELGRGVTSLTTTAVIPSLFKKIKHVEGADTIAQDIIDIYKAEYYGRVANSIANKNSLINKFSNYLKEVSGTVLSSAFANTAEIDFEAQKTYLRNNGVSVDTMTDTAILYYDTDDQVFVKLNIRMIDAMEDLSVNVVLN